MHSLLKTRQASPLNPPIPNKRRRIETNNETKEPLKETPLSLFSPRNSSDFSLSRSRSASYDKLISTLDSVFVDSDYGCDSEDLSWLKSVPSPVIARNVSIQAYIASIDPVKEDSPRPSNIIKDFFNFGVHILNEL
jgi:hypothetical protein